LLTRVFDSIGFITQHYSDQIRQRAKVDPLIAARDVSGFVQMVLAPELATKLIMDDMGITFEEALDILKESAELGEMVNDSSESISDDMF
jgi:hypothetical protein